MAGKIYTPGELLRLKNTPVNRELYNQLQEKLRKDQELGEVLRMPVESSLARITEEPANMAAGSESTSPRRVDAARQLDGTESEWRYRGRNDSEAIGAQPISAPTGLAAQKDEGFQRFYRAVVSPTHVRVTAGGRIVPNTRGSPSPTTRWSKDKSAVEATDNNSGRPPNRDLQQGQFLMPQHHFGFFPHHAMIPGFAPGMVPAMPRMPVVPGMAAISTMPAIPAMPPMPAMPAMPAMPPISPMHAMPSTSGTPGAPGAPAGASPYPIMPWPMGFGIGGPGGAPQPSLMSHASGLLTIPPNSATNERQDEIGASENATPTRSSPPENGDATRPYVQNGQWVFPPAAHFAMGTHPAFIAPSIMPMVAGHRLIPNHVMAPMAQSNVQVPHIPPHAMALSTPLQYPSVPTPTPSTGQHQSSIRASQITKKQLSVLRSSLKWAEDQLQYNKHQIDERTMELHAESLRYSIGHFEKVQDEQAANEKRSLPKDQAKEDMSDSASADEGRSKSPVTSSVKPENSAESFSSLPDESSIERAEKEMPTTQRRAFTSSHEDTAVQVAPAPQIIGVSDNIGANKRSLTLPVTAALAPPFQPRAVGGQATRDVLLGSGLPEPMYEQDASTKPYLVGQLPPGMSVEHARDTDYVYPRQLTEDELRARHMYWGKTPHHLQSGLPKFDGKNFYPPSPQRSHCAENDSELNNHGHDSLHVKASQVESGEKNAGIEVDPFQTSRHDPRQYGRGGVGIAIESDSSQQSGMSTNDSDAFGIHHSRQDTGKKGHRGSRHHVTTTDNPNARSESDSPDENDEKSIVFKGRNSLRQTRPRPSSGIWHDMMKRGTSSSNAVPGTVSSTTAQGVLPHYSGHATASLTPTATNINSSPREQATKSGNANEGGSANSTVERQIENRPPGDGKHHAYPGVQGSKKRTSVL
ncbi:uncharacterized protein TRIVIDRAFT_69519 [Trichoderma virens Gv29-8]|uniref:Uncharacterized protein n=1 Tax=Hypocrea virens (strain Gv29-8 / FGSC 10586) TaxID=413071 RepID=G9MGF3_HYPVG|nr:uncharacterized protein TRIVIDRAFT_69519 [Trichoderma virens Gv29-8]EHK26601.1 hypothetical protein TRIVIDRAFT_69519 [Trichoderma virens Gv29-8]UKZ46774.1 hypothetical protein TrVGV298_000984 [Trichoderma virens]